VVDAAQTYDADALYVAALELALRRGGLRTLTVEVEVDTARLKRALRALGPAAIVLTGRRATMDVLGRLVYAVRQAVPAVEVFDFRGALPDTGASTVCRLGTSPVGARQVLLERLTGPAIVRSPPVPPQDAGRRSPAPAHDVGRPAAQDAGRPARALRGA